jgi:hypothetical protein
MNKIKLTDDAAAGQAVALSLPRPSKLRDFSPIRHFAFIISVD